MGTDALGRDLFTRILYGGRISLAVGIIAVSIALLIGVPIGALAGYYGGRTDSVLMRFTDAFLSLPPFLVLILLSAILREVQVPFFRRNNVLTIAFVIGILSWMTFSRLVRAAFLTLREMDYVSASRALGSSDRRIILGHDPAQLRSRRPVPFAEFAATVQRLVAERAAGGEGEGR